MVNKEDVNLLYRDLELMDRPILVILVIRSDDLLRLHHVFLMLIFESNMRCTI